MRTRSSVAAAVIVKDDPWAGTLALSCAVAVVNRTHTNTNAKYICFSVVIFEFLQGVSCGGQSELWREYNGDPDNHLGICHGSWPGGIESSRDLLATFLVGFEVRPI